MSYTYPSSLDSLALEPLDQQPSQINEEAAAADLALWTNAKFTYDTTPGQGILDDKTTAPFDLDKVMYEQLVQYLDLDLNSAPQQQQPTRPTDTLGFDTTTTTTSYKPISASSRQQPTLLPKPTESINDSSLFLLPNPTTQQLAPSAVVTPASNDNSSIILNDNGKRPLSSSTTLESAFMEDRAHGDDDKRKRNTAASARFRIKKKQKEQAMAQTVREMTDKTDKLQSRVHELESEIKWLRELLLEKNSSK